MLVYLYGHLGTALLCSYHFGFKNKPFILSSSRLESGGLSTDVRLQITEFGSDKKR